jgi:hypothetical protein
MNNLCLPSIETIEMSLSKNLINQLKVYKKLMISPQYLYLFKGITIQKDRINKEGSFLLRHSAKAICVKLSC